VEVTSSPVLRERSLRDFRCFFSRWRTLRNIN
jgi:hypothetical protein